MTDTMKGCIVSFERDIREDDVQHLVEAIMMLKGVSGVSLSEASAEDYMNRERVARKIEKRIYQAFEEIAREGLK